MTHLIATYGYLAVGNKVVAEFQRVSKAGRERFSDLGRCRLKSAKWTKANIEQVAASSSPPVRHARQDARMVPVGRQDRRIKRASVPREARSHKSSAARQAHRKYRALARLACHGHVSAHHASEL